MPEPSHCLSDCPARKQQELSVTSLSTNQTGKGGGIIQEMRSCLPVIGKTGVWAFYFQQEAGCAWSTLVILLGAFLKTAHLKVGFVCAAQCYFWEKQSACCLEDVLP